MGISVVVVNSAPQRLRVGEISLPGTFAPLSLTDSQDLNWSSDTLGCPVDFFSSSWNSEGVDTRDVRFWGATRGCSIDRSVLSERFRQVACGEGARFHEGVKVLSGSTNGILWLVDCLADNRPLHFEARFVVEATGRAAHSVFQPDVKRIYFDQLMCVSATAEGASSDRLTAHVEATQDGWWYSAPLPDGQRFTAFFTDADLLRNGETRTSMLKRAAQHATQTHLKDIDYFARRASTCDARTSGRSVIWRKRWLSIGDAAWTVDPLSGAGIKLAIQDGMDAASAIERFIRNDTQETLRTHAVRRAEAFREALATQHDYYRIVQRWPAAPFWQRRRLHGLHAASPVRL